ncbi:MAG: S-layer homology domain-containing protein [Caryophanon sp.]|nr:S-layer homology domain-containing protein [Caryophanon sp.]
MRKWLVSLAAVLSLTIASNSASAETENERETATWYEKFNYVAIGDSLAFGINENSQPGKGYTEFVAHYLADNNILNSYSNGYSFPGYTTTDVYNAMKNNAVRAVDVGINLEELPAGTLDAIETADIITITAGANDLLQHVQRNDNQLTIDFAGLLAQQKKVAENYTNMLTTIRETNVRASIYIVGYYNAFAHLPAATAAQAGQLLGALNDTIAKVASENDATFIETTDAIAQDYKTYLPNPLNIHPSEAGYEVIAEEVIEELENDVYYTPYRIFATATSPTTVDVWWNAAYNEETLKSYNLYVDDELVAQVGPDETEITVEELEPGTVYEFDVTLTDTFGNEIHPLSTWEITPSEEGKYAFTDIATHADRLYIDRAANMGLVSGYEDNTYRPSQQVTRAQIVKLLTNALGLEHTEKAPFTDISSYAEETQHQIAAAYEAGIIQGTDGKFRPNEPVTRAQLALMISRTYTYLTAKEIDATVSSFSDISSYNEEAQKAMQFLYNQEIATGWEGKFMPGNPTMRSHAAKIIVNFVDSFLR